jgi:hypothetical protein
MSKILAVAVVSLLFPAAVLHGQTVSNPGWGFWFETPPGWVLQNCDADGAALAHATVPGMILVLPHSYKSVEALRKRMKDLLESEGMRLLPTKPPKEIGTEGMIGMYEGEFQGQKVRARVFGAFAPKVQKGCFVMGIALPLEYGKQLADAVDAVAKTIRLTGSQ